jgi:monoamine oxidase
VTILEAQVTAGGRVRTLRAPFADGLYGEAGAARIPDCHEWTMGYVRHFGLALTPFYPQPPRLVRILRGQRLVPEPGNTTYPPSLALTDDERRMRILGAWKRHVEPLLGAVGDPAAPDWPPNALRPYDRVSDAQLLHDRGLSPDAVAWEMLGDCDPLDGEWALSGLDALRTWAFEQRETMRYKIVGGNDLLPAAFARRLAERIVYGAEVVRIEQDRAGVRVAFRRLGTHHTLAAEHAICALPLPQLRRVDVSPPLSEVKQRAMRELTYDPVTRVLIQVAQRYWETRGEQGWALTDDPTEIWHPTWNQPGPRGLIVSYMRSRLGQSMAALDEDARNAATLAQIERVFPGIREHAEGAISVRWGEDPWARGAYVVLKPGQIGAFYPHLTQPEGRLHFAGEHASSLPNWMQGALESGVRAAREVGEAAD